MKKNNKSKKTEGNTYPFFYFYDILAEGNDQNKSKCVNEE